MIAPPGPSPHRTSTAAKLSSVIDLLGSEPGRAWLADHGLHLDKRTFAESLAAPVTGHFNATPDDRPVYVGQQIYADYRASVVRKFMALDGLACRPDIKPLAIWMDTDRAGADRLSTAICWPLPERSITIPIAPPGSRDREPRFIDTEPGQLAKAVKMIESALLMPLAPHERGPVRARIQRFGGLLTQHAGQSLSLVNLAITRYLLDPVLACPPEHGFVSDLLALPMLHATIDHCLRERPALIATLNEAIRALVSEGVDPAIKPVGDDYLPLFYACPSDAFRLRLRAVHEQGQWLAHGHCHRCGQVYRFPLGRNGSLSAIALFDTGRWSPDVLWPVFLAPLVSGLVVGRSTAAYGLVLNSLTRTLLSQAPPPMLLPRSLAESLSGEAPDSLLYRHLLNMEPGPA